MSGFLCTASLATGLPTTRRFVLTALATHADESGLCWPSQGLLASEVGISERAIRNHIHGLVADGWVYVLALGNGRGKATEYRLNVARLKAEKAEAEAQRKAEAERRKAEAGNTKAEVSDLKAEAIGSAQPSDPTISISTEEIQTPAREPIALFPELPEEPEDIALPEDPVCRELDRAGIPLTYVIRDDLDDYQRRGVPDSLIVAAIRDHPDKPWKYLVQVIETRIRKPQETTNARRGIARIGRSTPTAENPGGYSAGHLELLRAVGALSG